MDVQAGTAGVICAGLALGHLVIGWRWVLPIVEHAGLPATPFGPATLTYGMVRFTWHVVTLMLAGFSVLLLTLAFADGADFRIVVLRWFAVTWTAASAMAFWNGRHRLSSFVRFPVPFFFVAIAVLCWMASG